MDTLPHRFTSFKLGPLHLGLGLHLHLKMYVNVEGPQPCLEKC